MSSSGICVCYLVTGSHPYQMSFRDNYSALYFKILQGSTLPSFLSEGWLPERLIMLLKTKRKVFLIINSKFRIRIDSALFNVIFIMIAYIFFQAHDLILRIGYELGHYKMKKTLRLLCVKYEILNWSLVVLRRS